MKAFAGWRAVGRAMRWARRQDDITFDRTSMHGINQTHTDHRWRRGDDMVLISHTSGHRFSSVMVAGKGDGGLDMDGYSACVTLRVLAALGLIPAEQTACSEQCQWCGGAA